MDDDKVIDLVRAALDVDELEAIETGRTPLRHQVAPPRRRRLQLITGAVAGLAAAIGLFVVIRPHSPPNILDVNVKVNSVRSVDVDYALKITCDRAAYLAVFAIDDRHERWLFPMKDSSPKKPEPAGTREFVLPRVPRPDDPRGPAKAKRLLVIVSAQSISSETLLLKVPDPIVSISADDAQVQTALAAIARNLEKQFPCSTRIANIPE